MTDQANAIPEQKSETDTKANPPENKPIAIDSATPKAPVPAAEPETADVEKERKQA